MLLSYNKIFRQAWDLTKKQKFLWVYGLFLSLISLYFAVVSLLDSTNNTIVTVIGLVSVALFVLNFFLTAGLVLAQKDLFEKRETSFKKSIKGSGKFLGRLITFFAGATVGLTALALLVGLPIWTMFTHNFATRGVILVILGVAIILPVAVLALISFSVVPLFIILYNLKTKEAVLSGFDLAYRFWGQLLGFTIVLGLIDLPALFLEQFVLELRGGWVVLMLAGLVFLALQSVFLVFQQASWILAFQELVKPIKLEEEEKLPEPEPIGD